jgi:hypothetical protein
MMRTLLLMEETLKALHTLVLFFFAISLPGNLPAPPAQSQCLRAGKGYTRKGILHDMIFF